MSMEGVDYAFSNPSPAGLAAAGKRFAMRYVGPGTAPKHLTVTEANSLQAAGLSIVLLVEGAADSAAGGRSVGRQHAQQAVAMCRERGFPTNRPFYFAVDYDVNATTWAGPREYLRGACDVLGLPLVGVYGEYDAMVWAKRDGVASWFFQTYAWSGGRWFAGNHVEQYRNGVSLAGGTVDLCRAMAADFGQWQTNAPKEIDMIVAKVKGDPKCYLSDGLQYRQVISLETLNRLGRAGVPMVEVDSAAELPDLIGVPWRANSGAGLSYEETVKAAAEGANLAEDA